jgi:hypothetical protein
MVGTRTASFSRRVHLSCRTGRSVDRGDCGDTCAYSGRPGKRFRSIRAGIGAKRVAVEHRLAHLGRRQGPRARYRGTRKNLFDLRRTAAIQNLEVLDRRLSREVALGTAA